MFKTLSSFLHWKGTLVPFFSPALLAMPSQTAHWFAFPLPDLLRWVEPRRRWTCSKHLWMAALKLTIQNSLLSSCWGCRTPLKSSTLIKPTVMTLLHYAFWQQVSKARQIDLEWYMCSFLKGFRATNLFWELLSFPPRSPRCRPKGRSTGKRNSHCNGLQWCWVSFSTLKMLAVCSGDGDREPILPGPRYLGAWHHQWPGLTEWSLLVLLQPDRQCRKKFRLTMCMLFYITSFIYIYIYIYIYICWQSKPLKRSTSEAFMWLTMSLPVLLEQPNRRGGWATLLRLLEVWYSFLPPSADQKSAVGGWRKYNNHQLWASQGQEMSSCQV